MRITIRKKVLIYALCVIIAVICLFPVLYAVLLSFRSNYEIFAYSLPFTYHTIIPVDWTFENYIAIFRDYNMQVPLLNSLIVVAIAIPLSLLINGLAAYSFAVFQFRGKAVMLGLFMLSFMVPFDSISYGSSTPASLPSDNVISCSINSLLSVVPFIIL